MHRWAGGVCAATLVFIVVAVNAPTFDYGFVYDDNVTILQRAAAWEEGWSDFFFTRHWGLGRQLVLLTLDLNRGDPLSPRPFHVTNTLLAALLVVGVYGLARRLALSRPSAFVLALLFAVHPAHVDAIVSISGRAETMAAITVVSCVLLHARRYTPVWIGLPVAGVLLLAGLLSKENAIVVLPLVALYDWFIDEPRPRRERIVPYLVYGGVAALWLAWAYPHLQLLDPIAFVDNPLAHEPFHLRILHACEILWRYLGLLMWPVELRPDRSYADTIPSLAGGIVALVAWAALIALALRHGPQYPRLAFTALWFPAAFLVTGNVLWPVGTIMAERLVLLPSVGPALLLGLAIERAWTAARRTRPALVFLTAVATFALALGYTSRARVWANEAHFYEISALDAPKSAKAWYNLGLARGAAGDFEGAEAALRRALEIYPKFDRAAYFLAEALIEQGRPEAAVEVWEKYVGLTPDDAGALSQLATLYLATDRFADARRTAERLVGLDPTNEGHRNLLDLVNAMAAARRAADRVLLLRAWKAQACPRTAAKPIRARQSLKASSRNGRRNRRISTYTANAPSLRRAWIRLRSRQTSGSPRKAEAYARAKMRSNRARE